MTFPLEPGEHRVDLLIEFEGGDLPRHVAYLSTPKGRLGMIELFQKAQIWLDTPGSLSNRLAEATSLGRATRTFEPGEPAVLLRYRAQEVELLDGEGGKIEQRVQSPSTPSDGLMLWIEKVP
jgi:hypothetical protein